MATLVLSTVGRAAGGPLGTIVGATLGNVVDRLALGGGAPREVGRIADLTLQSSAYGAPLPIIHGRMRVAGNVIWSNGIDERQARSRGKGRSRATVFSYTASFAVALAARPITTIGRIWADGRLLRDADGAFTSPVTWRLHHGDEDQLPDPLIAAAEGQAPAYRGLAYVVFEDLPLADWGNRIPNLSFELIADTGPVDAGRVIVDLAARQGLALAGSGDFPQLDGHILASSGRLIDDLAPLLALSAATTDGDGRLRGRGSPPSLLPDDDRDAQPVGAGLPAEQQRQGAGRAIGGVELLSYDPARDYQPGLQRVRRDGGALERQSLAAALPANAAKALAAALLAGRAAGRTTATVRLPWRHLGLVPGDVLAMPGDDRLFQVLTRRFENFVLILDVVGIGGATAAPPADPGRVAQFADAAAGPTGLQVLDLPPLPGELPTTPRLWIAGAGAAPGWRTAAVAVSRDRGTSFEPLGTIVGGTIMGTTLTALPAGSPAVWDNGGTVDIALVSPGMWLEPASDGAVLAGANLALVGAELVQFAAAEALAPGRFRLSRLLRGRRGSEAAIYGHRPGEVFVLLDVATMLPLDPDLASLGQDWLVRAEGSGDRETPAVAASVGGAVLRPLSPVHLRLTAEGGDRIVQWVRRSRAGFGWIDHVDAPLAESREAWSLVLRRGATVLRRFELGEPRWRYTAMARAADGPAPVTLDIAQLSDAVGPGAIASINL